MNGTMLLKFLMMVNIIIHLSSLKNSFQRIVQINIFGKTFCFSKQKIEILDAGAGTGILAAAVVQKLYELGYVGKIYVTCYVRGISF